MRQKTNIFLICLLIFGMKPVFSADCVATIAKDSCWQPYSVDLSIYDSVNNTVLTTAHLPKGQSLTQVEFSCQANQVLKVLASYSPMVTNHDVSQYQLDHYITLPSQEPAAQAKWEFNFCFGKDFVELPIPASYDGHCQCQFDKNS